MGSPPADRLSSSGKCGLGETVGRGFIQRLKVAWPAPVTGAITRPPDQGAQGQQNQ